MTYSIGFRSPGRGELAREVLQRVADAAVDELGSGVYADPFQSAVADSARMPAGLQAFAVDAVQRLLATPHAMERALGEYLSEPKAQVWFEEGAPLGTGSLRLDRRSRMLYDARHVFLNGESYRAAGRDATLMRRLADQRWLAAADVQRLSAQARELLAQWCEDGWVHGGD